MPRLSNPLPEKKKQHESINYIQENAGTSCLASKTGRPLQQTSHKPRVNYKICLKSSGLHEFFVWFCVVSWQVTFEKCLNFHGLSRQETIASCLDRLSKLRHFPMFIAFKQHNRKPNKKTKCKPADFWKILQFTCMHRPYVSYVDLCAKDNCGLIYTHLRLRASGYIYVQQ